MKLKKYTYLIAALCVLTVAALIENNLLKRNPETSLIDEFQSTLLGNEQELKSKMAEATTYLKSDDFGEKLGDYFSKEKTLIRETGFGVLVYLNDQLFFWSDRGIAFYNSIEEYELTKGLISLSNGYYLVDTLQYGDYCIVGLHLVKRNYSYENKYLQNNFSNGYNLPGNYLINQEPKKGAYNIVDAEGAFLFSLLPHGNYLCNTDQLYFPAVIYLLGLILLLLYFRREFVERQAPFIVKLLGLAAALFLTYWFHIIFEVPKVFFHLKFFGPDFFAINDWLPSLGDYFLLSLFFVFWMYNFGVDLNIAELSRQSRLPRKFIAVLLLLFSASLYLLVNYLIIQLIDNSTISFALNKIIDTSIQSAIGIFSMGLFLLGVVFFTIRICEESKEDFKLASLSLAVTGIVVFLAAAQFLAVGIVSVPVLLLFLVCSLLAFFVSRNYLHTFTLSYLIIFVSAVSWYSLVVMNQTITQKDREHQKLLAVTLVAERDPAAQVFMAEIQSGMGQDPAIQSLLFQKKYRDVEEYIRKSYFNTYFRKYLLNIYVCDNSSFLEIDPDQREVLCRPYLDNMIDIQGIQVPGTDFYFMDNMNGRISYTGKFDYPTANDNKGVSIYIDLDSDLLFEGIGFPELLIDKSMARSENYRKFGYAKYYGGDLTDKYGDYNYNLNAAVYYNYISGDEEFTFLKQDRYEHLLYYIGDESFVIVSREQLSIVDYLISFPYLFVFYFLNLLLILMMSNQTIRERKVFFDLKFKIQAAIISIVFISLLVVALATLYYNIEEYKEKHRNDLNEKMKSIAEEIDNRLTDKEEITPELEIWLHHELAKLSNIFRTDINIYGIDGEIIASSRFEIFERGLVSAKINAKANYELYQNFQLSYFQPENIGKLSYLSAYRPIINNSGYHLGIINLPYFIRQDKYSQEISTFIVAFINLYVLLFLASIIAAVFIANQITRPLVVIQENLKKMQLGKRNEPIHYNRKDEIGSLVKEYNKKVDELSVSAELLARSERESAWREMAKQIAHEIKNPLTPMKLNIQYLQRAEVKDAENQEYLDRVTNTLIEQIDNLSNIATEFSNFAKIPKARNQVFNLADQLQKTIDLYETHDKAQITFHSQGLINLRVNADREQLSRAIINLIRNGIQAMPVGEVGKVSIELSRREHMALIAVTDNGAGIPLELRDKLFSPSFTTKSSGMGLGLSIVKNIVENFSGIIWFATELGKGTTFFVEIPVYEDENKTDPELLD